jgi:Asp-tRNA(Asn)/Glu-tRNA(Gln) amidotransferase A subunit family amidase
MSFDTIGPLANSVEDAKIIHDIIKGQDNFDSTTKDFPKVELKKKYTIGLVDVEKYAKPEVKDLIYEKTATACYCLYGFGSTGNRLPEDGQARHGRLPGRR